MDYIYFKENFPKTCQKFFEWVSIQDPNCQNDYADNIYFYQFSCDILGTQWSDKTNYYSVGSGTIYITEKSHIELILPQLDSSVKKKRIYMNHGQKYYEDHNVCLDKFSDTQEDFLRIDANNEKDFNIVFKCLEILLNNGIYE